MPDRVIASTGASDITARQLHRIFAEIDEGFCICEMIPDEAGKPADYRFLHVNQRFEDFTGLRAPVGRTALELVPGLERRWIDAYGRAGLGRESLRFVDHSDQLGRTYDVFATPVEPYGCFAIVFRDVTDARRLEREREAALARSRQLLEELNHRVMNSLGMIAAITSVESSALESEDGKAALQRVRARIEALGSLYRLLTANDAVGTVEARNYLASVVNGVAGTLAGHRDVRVKTDIADVALELPVAVPLALICNELVTNCLKYAFEGVDLPMISLQFRVCDGRGVLEVRDNGRGFSEETRHEGSGVGNRLIEAFATQLNGRLERSSTDTGAAVTLCFPLHASSEVPAA